ncbi:nuclear transport factor 2 family protein [Edaphobacter bradus]|uniref:nuclear transport factor 2 family protein n=1 Tax=Edaphobacter bradus TaxID=2259016 RepID=UPI0021DFE697|nr:nuclear transport factor 2 family protein [Edaphobacter bradus]
MKRKWNSVTIIAALLGATLSTAKVSAQQQKDAQLLRVREAVWRSWFADDTKTLEKLVPPGTIVISAGDKEWKNQAEVFRAAAEFHAKGGKLIRLEFPRTEVQHFGDVAIIYSKYLVETEQEGKRSAISGRATEVFVLRNGQWTNPGWHTDAEK